MSQKYQQELLKQLYVKRKISLNEAMQLFDISESTARRLFTQFEKNGLAIRTHGCLRCNGFALTSYSFERGEQTNIDQKTAIAKKACELLEDGDIIFCDSGTTIHCFCAELVMFLQKNKLNLQVCTNSLANLEILSPHLPVTLIGGDFRQNRRDFCGYIAEHALEKLYFNKSFVGTDGFVSPAMFTTTDHQTARMDEIAIQHSKDAFLLTDTSKFSHSSHITYVNASELKAIITDSPLPKEIEEGISKHNCTVLYATPHPKK